MWLTNNKRELLINEFGFNAEQLNILDSFLEANFPAPDKIKESSGAEIRDRLVNIKSLSEDLFHALAGLKVQSPPFFEELSYLHRFLIDHEGTKIKIHSDLIKEVEKLKKSADFLNYNYFEEHGKTFTKVGNSKKTMVQAYRLAPHIKVLKSVYQCVLRYPVDCEIKIIKEQAILEENMTQDLKRISVIQTNLNSKIMELWQPVSKLVGNQSKFYKFCGIILELNDESIKRGVLREKRS